MTFSWYIARRYLRSRRHTRYLSRVGVTAIIGISIGVMVLDLTLAIMNGFDAEMRRTFIENMPMITVATSRPEGFRDLGAAVDTIGTTPGVIGVAPFIRQEVVVSARGRTGVSRHRAVVVWGIDPILQDSVTPLSAHLFPGRMALERLQEGDAEAGRLILGIELSVSLFAGIGDTVIVTAPRGDLDLDHLEAESRRFVVAGLLDSGMYEFDARFAYVSLPEARDFFQYGPQGATGIGVKLADMMTAPAVARSIEHRLGSGEYHAGDWIAQNRNLFQWIKIEKIVMFLLLGLIVLVAAVNIIGILTMMVGERSREIGILLSMGARRWQIQGIFIWDGLFIGLVGAVFGSVLGYLGTVYLDRFGFKLPGDVYFVDHIPVLAQGNDFLLVALATLAITFLATLLPSREAATLKPMDIIRYT
jgi:lipoprotein-releasing system permease protein